MSKILHDIDGHGEESEMFAFLSIDEKGRSGIMAVSGPLGVTPCIGMTLADMDRYRPAIESVRNETDKTVKLVRYTKAEEITF